MSYPRSLFKNEYAFGAQVLRYAFGLLFVLVAMKKFRMGYGGFASSLTTGDGLMAQEIPDLLLLIYGYLLPALELLAGVLLLVNMYVQEAYAVIAFIYLSFIFGQMYDGNTVKIGTEYLPSLIALSFAVFFRMRSEQGRI
jgi:hypothetical protein